MLQEANGAGVKGDKKFSSNLDKSFVTFHPEHHFPSTGKAELSEILADRSTRIAYSQQCKIFCEQFPLELSSHVQRQ